MADSILQVVTTTASQEEARRIAAAVIEARLAACAQVGGPIESHYRWQGKLQTSKEWTVTMKTTAAAYQRLEQEIRRVHSYEQPEILATPAATGSEGYLKWVAEEVAE